MVVLLLFGVWLLRTGLAQRRASGPSITMVPVEWVWAAFMIVSVSFKLCAATLTVENNVRILARTIEKEPIRWVCLQGSLGGVHALLPNRSLRWKSSVLAVRLGIQALCSLTLYYRGGQGAASLLMVHSDAFYLVYPFVGAFTIGELTRDLLSLRSTLTVFLLGRAIFSPQNSSPAARLKGTLAGAAAPRPAEMGTPPWASTPRVLNNGRLPGP